MMPSIQARPFRLFFVTALLMMAWNFASAYPANAAWNLPSCNPDTVGPTDPSCNVSAPLNVSSSDQTKLGGLTIQSTLNAGDLNVSNAYGGDGSIAITTVAGSSITISHSDASQSAIDLSTNSNQPAVSVTQSGSGTGIDIATGAAQAIVATSASSAVATANFINSSSSSALTASNDSASNTAFFATNANASALGAIQGCNGSVNCATFGSSTHAGTFSGIVAIGKSGAAVSGSPALSAYSSGAVGVLLNNSNASGVGISLTSSGNTATGVSISMTGTTGTGLSISSTGGVAGSFSSGAATGNVVSITNSSTGEGLGVSTGGVAVSSIPLPSGWPVATGQGIRATSATSFGVVGYSTAATGFGAGVYGRATSDYGVVAYSQSNYGLFANTQSSSFYGLASCNTMTSNCAYLGGGTYSGNFTGRVLASTSVVNNPVVTINNTNNTAPFGYALSVRGMSNSVTAITAPQGTAVDAQTFNGYAVHGYSENGAAAIYGQSGSTSGYGGHFVAVGDSSTAVYAENTNATSGVNKYGIQALATTPSGVGIQATSHLGKAGEFISNSGGYGIYVDAASATSGIFVTASGAVNGVDVNVDDFAPAIVAHLGTISSSGGFKGGQFYPNEHNGSALMPNVAPVGESRFTVSSRESARSMIFDGNQLWVLGASSFNTTKLYRYKVSTFQRLHTSDTGYTNATKMVLLDDLIYVFEDSSASVFTENIRTGATATASKSTTASVTASTVDGTDIWFGTSNAVYEWDGSGAAVSRKGSIGSVSAIVYANGYIWAADSTNDVVYRILPTAPYTSTTINVGDNPQALAYDGSSLWVANTTADTLSRIDASTLDTVSYSVSTLGSGPNLLKFDGVNLWIGFNTSTEVGYFNIADEAVSATSVSLADDPTSIEFDGTRIWVGEGTTSALDTGDVYSIYTGAGYGTSSPTIHNGILVYDVSGTIYCSYISGGTWTISTTLTNCQ